MKKTIFILSVSFLLYACGDKPENPTPEPPPYQPYTSFVVWHDEDAILTDCVAGYPDSTGYWHKIDTLGTLTKGVYSKEVIFDTSVTKVFYLFSSMGDGTRLDTVFRPINNIKNIIQLHRETRGIMVNMRDHYEYPF